MAELNMYISDGLKREMNYFQHVDWERVVQEAVWKKISNAKKGTKSEKPALWEDDF